MAVSIRVDAVEVDVAIIGAGPAGSTLAALLARRGMSVALVDRDRFPRDKLCGEFLSYDALPILERLGVLEELDRRGAPLIDRCRVVGRSRSYEFGFPHPARGVSRLLLDELLENAAVAAGAHDFTGQQATGLGPGTSVALEDGMLSAKVIAGAWGRWGRFDAQLKRQFVHDRSHRHFGFKRHYSNGARVSSPAPILLYSFTRGYLGVNPIESDLTNLCGLVHASRLTNHKGRWDAFVEAIREEDPQLDALYGTLQPAQDNFLSSEPVIFRARSPVEDGVIMVGDASGIVDPLTGNGMAMAIQSALLAAPFIVELAAGTRDRQAVQNAYRSAHRDFFSGRIRWSRRIARLLSNPRLLNLAMFTVRSPQVGELFLRRTRADEEAASRLVKSWFW
ncbi:MAG TPA: NAD(P)/FAD-dependent oxidoreductase [Thermoanaerobaculia bacterium]|nr:NAD(P)/FAD-dependent oxidoreductase [Thermoanaerobaculia bacterium]